MPDTTQTRPAKADLTDIRVIIGAALGLIGLFLLIVAFTATGPEQLAKTGGINGNLWSGLGLLVVAVVMAIWWRVNPTGGASGGGH
ncbi:MAG: cell division protein CrgA [Propioniciclava sp.]|uniref:cell division protein CrgA n=1 Tax=Propioniciclava sp. TaxID=2038686 RepID=UPI0039E56400